MLNKSKIALVIFFGIHVTNTVVAADMPPRNQERLGLIVHVGLAAFIILTYVDLLNPGYLKQFIETPKDVSSDAGACVGLSCLHAQQERSTKIEKKCEKLSKNKKS